MRRRSRARSRRAPRILLVASEANAEVTRRLEAGARRVLARAGAKVRAVRVPGAFEIPRAVARLAGGYDGVVALGCVVRGETRHDELVAGASAYGLMNLAVRPELPPIGFGILWAPDEATARARATPGRKGKVAHRGEEAAAACLRMIELERKAS